MILSTQVKGSSVLLSKRKEKKETQMLWHKSVTPALGRLRWENCKCEASLARLLSKTNKIKIELITDTVLCCCLISFFFFFFLAVLGD
jgi:hypothetical protein